MSITATETHVGRFSKAERYGWRVLDRPGVLMDVDKSALVIDDSYQRLVNEAKMLALASEWSWTACGALIVADRGGVFYVIDGQHRLMAARRRSDIRELPCIVFETEDVAAEAVGFLRANTMRKPLTGIDKFKAMLATRNEHALLVQELCDSVGREVKNSPTGASVRCVTRLLFHAKNDPERLRSLWRLVHEICHGSTIDERVLDSLMYIEAKMPSGQSLMDQLWRKRLLKIGKEGIVAGAARASAFYTRGGPRVWATGVVQALNYGNRIRLNIFDESSDD